MRTTTILTGLLALCVVVVALPTAPAAFEPGGQGQEVCASAVDNLKATLEDHGLASEGASDAMANAIEKCKDQPPVYAWAGTDVSDLGSARAGSGITTIFTATECAGGDAFSERAATFGFRIIGPDGNPQTFPNNFALGDYQYDPLTGHQTYTGADLFVSFTATNYQQTVSLGPITAKTYGTITVAGITLPADGGWPTGGCNVAGAVVCRGEGYARYNRGFTIEVFGNLDTCK